MQIVGTIVSAVAHVLVLSDGVVIYSGHLLICTVIIHECHVRYAFRTG